MKTNVGNRTRSKKKNKVAAEYVVKNPDKRERLILICKPAGGAPSFKLPNVIMAMRMTILNQDEMEKVVWENPKKFFKMSLKGDTNVAGWLNS